MEYLLGSITTFIMVVWIVKMIRRDVSETKLNKLRYNQSSTFEQIKGHLPGSFFKVPENKNSQLWIFHNSLKIKIIFVGNEAYWIKDNVFYVAEIINGYVDYESAKAVDTMGMDKIQLDKMSFIVEKLTEE
jgi:hypothetical protein